MSDRVNTIVSDVFKNILFNSKPNSSFYVGYLTELLQEPNRQSKQFEFCGMIQAIYVSKSFLNIKIIERHVRSMARQYKL